MADQRCRVTVVGEHRRVSLAVPAAAPIAEYVTTIAGLCGQPEDDSFPAVWSLAAPGLPPYPVTISLDSAGVLDGQVLYLRDLAEGEDDEVIVAELEEAVEGAAEPFERWTWTRRNRAVTWIALAACWLVGALIALAVTGAPHVNGGVPVALGLGSGIVSAGLVMAARRRDWPLPPALLFGLALSVLPEMAVAGRFALPGPVAPVTVALAASVGLLIGSVFCIAAIPDAVMVPVPVGALVGFLSMVLLAGLGADGAQSAALVVVVSLGLTSVAPQAIGALVATSSADSESEPPQSDETADQVRRAWWLLAAVNVVLSVALAIALVVLASSPNVFAVSLAACAAAALVLRVGTRRYLTEIVPMVLAGAAGILTLLLELPRWLAGASWSGALAVVIVGFGLFVAGLAGALRPGHPGERRRFLGPVGVLLGIASVPLMLGVFHVFGHLETLGHHL
ncbi:MAG TPA: type VII secretion integral membrane protein EccD [Trebonia sp.]